MEIQWSLVLFTALSGLGAWLFACIGLSELKGAPSKTAFAGSVLAVVLLAVGGICSVTHLSHPERMLEALNHPTSGIFVEALLLGLLAVAAAVYAILTKRDAPSGARKVFAAFGVVLAIALTYACGSSYMMDAQLTWNTVGLPLAYMGTAAASGTALFAVMCGAMKDDEGTVKFAGALSAADGAIALACALFYGIAGGIAFGSFSILFWIAVALCGGVAPVVFGLMVRQKPENSVAFGAIALVGALVGSVTVRALMWAAGVALMSLFGIAI